LGLLRNENLPKRFSPKSNERRKGKELGRESPPRWLCKEGALCKAIDPQEILSNEQRTEQSNKRNRNENNEQEQRPLCAALVILRNTNKKKKIEDISLYS
jgi:hypothetical protein